MIQVKSFFKNIMSLFIGCILAFLIIEGILRIYNPFDSRVKGDKIILPVNTKYVTKPKQKKDSKFDETVIHTKNSIGFRGEEPPADISKYLTIITVGGSTTECSFLTDGKTWTDVLGNKLKEKFRDLWINNAGFDGHSTFGHIVLMEDYIVKLKPSMVLFLIGANDQVGIDELGEFDNEILQDKFMFHSKKAFIKSMANHSEIVSLGLNIYRAIRAKRGGVAHQEINFEVFSNVDLIIFLSDENIQYEKQSLENHKLKYLEKFKNRLNTLIKISEDHDIEPVLITQPSFYGDFIDDVTNVNFRFTKVSWELLELYNDVVREVGEKNNIFVIDLAREMPKSSKYYYDWIHYGNEGAEKVAEIIYNNLYPYLNSRYIEYEIN